MRRDSGFDGVLALVEGTVDRTAYTQHVANQRCHLIVAGGYDLTLSTAAQLAVEGDDRVVALVDRDFRAITGDPLPIVNGVATGLHDVELELIQSPALETVLWNHSDELKLMQFLRDCQNLVGDLLKVVAPIGALRLESVTSDLGLKFRGLDVSAFVNPNTMAVDVRRLVQVVKQRSNRFGLSDDDLQNRVDSILAANHDLTQLCNGHDVVAVVALLLRRRLGASQRDRFDEESLGHDLAKAYPSAAFHASSLARELETWAAGVGVPGVLKGAVTA